MKRSILILIIVSFLLPQWTIYAAADTDFGGQGTENTSLGTRNIQGYRNFTETIQIMKNGMDLAADLCEEGLCIAIGEIGRPHFPIEEQELDDSNNILFYGMKKAKDADVPVVLHTESTTPKQCKELSEMGKKAGLIPQKIVKHYAPPLILESENFGLMPSVLASKKNIFSAIQKGTRFMLETDYLDDPFRPGAVLGPKTIPRKTIELMEKEIVSEEQLLKIHKENPEKTYGICLD